MKLQHEVERIIDHVELNAQIVGTDRKYETPVVSFDHGSDVFTAQTAKAYWKHLSELSRISIGDWFLERFNIHIPANYSFAEVPLGSAVGEDCMDLCNEFEQRFVDVANDARSWEPVFRQCEVFYCG